MNKFELMKVRDVIAARNETEIGYCDGFNDAVEIMEREIVKPLIGALKASTCWNLNAIGARCRPKMEDICPRCAALSKVEGWEI